MLTQNNAVVAKTDNLIQLRQKIKAIFAQNNLPLDLIQQITEGTMYSNLLRQRIFHLYNLLGLNGYHSLATNEQKLLNKILASIKEILNNLESAQSASIDWVKVEALIKEFFFHVYDYIVYRSEGILQHINTHGMEQSYPQEGERIPIHYEGRLGFRIIKDTFAEHKTKREKELDDYFSSPVMQGLFVVLHNTIPGIFQRNNTFAEVMYTASNEYTEHGVEFVTPPYLEELLITLNALAECMSARDIKPHHVSAVKVLQKKWKNIQFVEHCEYWIKNAYQTIELLSQWSQALSAAQGYIWRDSTRTLKTYLAAGSSFHLFIHYPLLNISEHQISEARKVLNNSHSTLQQKIAAKKNLLFASAPWRMLRCLGLFLLKNWEGINVDELILKAIPDLQEEFREFLSFIFSIIELEIIENQLANDKPLKVDEFKEYWDEPVQNFFSVLKNTQAICSFSADHLFLNKIDVVLNSIDWNNLKKPYAVRVLLRILSILGESEKYLSIFVKNKLLNTGFWLSVGKFRDKVVHAKQLESLLEDDRSLFFDIVKDLKNLAGTVKTVKQDITHNSWNKIKESYLASNSTSTTKNMDKNSLDKLLFSMDSGLNREDCFALRETQKNRPDKEAEYRDNILKVMQRTVKATEVTPALFESWIAGLYLLRGSDKKQLKTAYDKLCIGNIEQKVLASCIKILETPADYTSDISEKVERLIKKLKKINTVGKLEKELQELNLSNSIGTWQEKWEKINKKNSSLPNASDENDEQACNNLEEVIKTSTGAVQGILVQLNKLAEIISPYKQKISIAFHKADLAFAVEYHFILLRNYIGDIEKGLIYFRRYDYDVAHPVLAILNKVIRLIELRLASIREYGNFLAHLHDVMHFNGVTPYGNRVQTLSQVMHLVEGDPSIRMSSFIAELQYYYDNLSKQNRLLPPPAINVVPHPS